MAKYIAVAGKGGVGKTTFTSLMLKYLVRSKQGASILAVDADPNANLNEALGLDVEVTISELLEQTKDPKAIPTGMPKDVFVEYKLNQSLVESKQIDLLVMGGPQGPGCYCYPNDLLRKHLENLSENYDYVVVDTEAGLEHLSRKTIQKIDIMFVISDCSARGIRSAGRVFELIKGLKTPVEQIYLVVTKTTEGSLENLMGEINNTGLELIGDIPLDQQVVLQDLQGKALFELPEDAAAVQAVEKISQKAKV